MKRTIIKAKRLLCGALAATMILQSALTYITPEVVYAVEDTDTPDSGDEGDELNNEPNNGVDELEPNDGSDEGITPYSDGDGHWDEGLTVNDGTDKTYYYGQKLVVKYKDDDKMYHGYIKAGEGDDTEQEGTPTEPGKYRISAYTGKTGVYAFAEIE
ncbi:MAG: hypothetical protein Q4D29_13220, partial [Lachnospiraceae bacterium]|nr:hypothetical protein [Lachnospiraceae bacterium]